MKKTIIRIAAGLALLSAVSVVQAGEFTVPSNLAAGDEFWISSEYASEYVYETEDLPEFASLLLSDAYVNNPTGISISLWDEDTDVWSAWVALTFDTNGVHFFPDDVESFRLSGIDPAVGKDAGEALFLTGFTFEKKTADTGSITLGSAKSVPEPATALLLAFGLLGLGLRKKQ